jgi:hypothetical protein
MSQTGSAVPLVLQEAMPCGVVPVGPGQVVQAAPQLVARTFERQVPFAVFLQKLVSQAVPHAPLVQTGCAFGSGGLAGHAVQVPFPLPHSKMLSLASQVPVVNGPHRWVPAAHMDSSHTPALLQVMPAAHGAQAPSTVPQKASESLRTQTPLHAWRPAAQVYVQAPPTQATVALARGAQGIQLVPQLFTLVLDEHIVGLTVGHPWKPASQVMPHVRGGPPPQFGEPLAGSAQTVHMFPHDVTDGLLSTTQVWPHR